MTKSKTRLLTVGRWGLLLALLGLGVTLVFSAWANRREAEQISALLDRGQADRFFRPIPRLHEQRRGPASSDDLARLLSQFEAEGLRYIGEYDQSGKVVSEAGTHGGAERPRPARSSQQPALVGGRVRITFHPPAHGIPGMNYPLPDVVLEFEPTVANRLRERATRNFVFSTTAAVSLLVLTLALWFALVREERRREQSERERQLASLGEMSAVLAHEIRNPLASLKGHAQLLGEQLDVGSPLQKKVERIVNESKRLEELTSSLLDLVRASSVSVKPTDPAQLVRDAAETLDGARIVVDAARAPKSWPLDALRMDQVLKNLLQNAVQASPVGGSIEVLVSAERSKLLIRIRDHGPGLPAGAEQRVFEAFHTTRVHGTGLGLAIARRIIELHGGEISARNHAEGGAVFTLALPG